MTKQDNELYQLMQPLLDLPDQRMMPLLNRHNPSLLSWGIQSGYYKWAKQQPEPINRYDLQKWIVDNRQKAQLPIGFMNPSKSLIDIYHARQSTSKDEALGKAVIQKKGELGLHFINTMSHISTEYSKKYRFRSSAINMLTYLSSGEGSDATYHITLPPTSVWLELETPLLTPKGFLSAINFRKMEVDKWMIATQRKLSIPSSLYQLMYEEIVAHSSDIPPESWGFELICCNGAVFEQMLYTPKRQRGEWRRKGDACPTCDRVQAGELMHCPECMLCLDYYASLLNTSLLMISGAFAESEEPPAYEQVSEQVLSRVPRENNPKKTKVTISTRHYSIVTFDACHKTLPTGTETREERGSWIEAAKAVDPNAILYVDRHIAKTERTLHHARYINKRGQTITVKAHNKRIPMKASELKRKITRVIASKFESEVSA